MVSDIVIISLIFFGMVSGIVTNYICFFVCFVAKKIKIDTIHILYSSMVLFVSIIEKRIYHIELEMNEILVNP